MVISIHTLDGSSGAMVCVAPEFSIVVVGVVGHFVVGVVRHWDQLVDNIT